MASTMQVWLVTIPATNSDVKRIVSDMSLMASQYRPEASLFHSIFPFHLVLNEKLRVIQVIASASSTFQCVYIWYPVILATCIDQNLNAALFTHSSSLLTRQVGSGLKRLVPELKVGTAIADHLTMTIPYTGWDFNVTNAVRNAPFVIETKTGASFRVSFYLKD